MKDSKLFISFFILLFALLLNAQDNKSVITTIDDKLITFTALSNIKLGSSALVVRELDNHKVILAYAIATSSSSAKLIKYSNLQQSVFPSITSKPQVGDTLIFNFYYDRHMIIAPNKNQYNIAKDIIQKQLIHPDLLAMILSDDSSIKPTKEDFLAVCQDYSIGVIDFIIEDKIQSVDCVSFQVIGNTDIKTNSNKTVLPFFTDIKIEKGLFNFQTLISSFDEYYKKLLDLK